MSAPEELQAQATAVEMPGTTEKAAVENVEASSNAQAVPVIDRTVKNGESSKPTPQAVPLSESLLQRVSTIKEGDNVLLRMPSDMVKAVVASKDGCASPCRSPDVKLIVDWYNWVNSGLFPPNSY